MRLTAVYSGLARIFFGGGGRPGHLRAITRLPHGVRGRQPPDGNEDYNFKTIQTIRKRIDFARISAFSCPKTHFQKISKNQNFRKITLKILKFQFLWSHSINSHKFPTSAIIFFRDFSKNSTKLA